MKPQPMSDARYKELARRQTAGPHGDSLIGSEQIAGFARAIIAARDAQWAAMIGEPDGWQMRMRVDGREWGVWTQCADHSTDKPLEYIEGPLTMQFRPLYAIKETPLNRRVDLATLAADLASGPDDIDVCGKYVAPKETP